MVALRETAFVLAPEPEAEAELPAAVLDHFRRGNALYDAGDFVGALREYDDVLALRSDLPEAHNNRGVALGLLDWYEEALAAFDRSLALRPDYPEAHSNRGVALDLLDRYEEALAAFQQAIKLEPEFSEAHIGYGGALLQLKHYQEALAAFDTAIAVGSDDEGTRALRAAALKKLLRGVASGGREAWLGHAPLGSNPPIVLKPGPSVADAIIEDRR